MLLNCYSSLVITILRSAGSNVPAVDQRWEKTLRNDPGQFQRNNFPNRQTARERERESSFYQKSSNS